MKIDKKLDPLVLGARKNSKEFRIRFTPKIKPSVKYMIAKDINQDLVPIAAPSDWNSISPKIETYADYRKTGLFSN